MKIFSRNLTLLFLVFLVSGNIEANNTLKWYGFNEGLAKAQKENKILLVDFYTDWCGWCKKMDENTYKNKKVVDYLNKNFVVVKLNPEKEGSVKFQGSTYKNNEFSSAAGVTGFPATAFFTAKSEFIKTFPGYMDAENFLDLLKKLVEAVKQG